MTTFFRRLLGCFLFLLVFSGFVLADQGGPSAAGVAWADNPDVNFNWIEISDGTALDTSVNDTFYTVNMPFTFNFYNRPFSTVYVSNNGYLTFHDYTTENFAANDSLELDQSPDSLIAVFWDDFNTLSGGSAQIYYKTVGTSPYRRFIVEYRNVTLAAGGGPLSFQIILYESLNLIKFQYLTLGSLTDLERGDSATVGLRYTGNMLSDNLIYSLNAPNLGNNLAVLFYPRRNLAASFAVNPDTVALGTGGQPFSITVNNLSLVNADSLQQMGKGDSVRINNPFTNNMSVTGVRVDGQNYFYQNDTIPPADPGLATWNYSSGTQNLTVLLPPLAVKDSITIDFVENIPTTPGDFNFTAEIASRLNPTGAFSSPIPLHVEATTVARYTFSPSVDTVFAAGDTISYTLKAEDQFGNGVLNSGSVNLSAIGSMTASFPTNPVAFTSDSVLTFEVTDTKTGDFNVRAVNTVNSGITGQSELIMVNPAPPDTLITLSSTSNIKVGTTRLLQVQLEDVYGNVIKDSLVTFRLVSGGNGSFGGSDSTQDLTNTSGVAEALYTASTHTSFGIDTIRVSIGGVADSISLPLVSGSISHFDLTIQTAMPAAAGDTVAVRVVAKDEFNNGVLSPSSVIMSRIGSSTAQFIPSDTYGFGGDSAVTISVRDDVVETFSVRAQLVGDPTKQGTSGEITVNPAPPDTLITLSSEADIEVGTTRLLQVRLEDAFNNVISDSVVTFEMVSGGNGNFVGSDSTPTTNSSGVAEALYTASTSTSFGIDIIRVSIGSVVDSISLPLISGLISQFDLTILTAMPAAAGDTVSVRVVAKDLYDNPVVSSSQYQMTAIGSGTATFIPPSAVYTFSSDSADTISVRDTKKGFFTVKAQLSSNPTKQGTSGQIEITPASLDYLRLRSLAGNKGISLSNVPFIINSSQNIVFYAAGYDQFNNYIDDIDTAFWDDTGTLVHTGTFPVTASSYTFDPAGVGTGRIFISNSGVTPDTTGLIEVTGAQLSYIQIQSDSADGGSPVSSRTLAAGQTDTLYAVGYDIDNNWLGTVSSDWSVNNTNLGTFQNGFPNISGEKQVVFTAEKVGNGVIDAAAVIDPSIDDQTGLYTVIAGPSDHILIRSASNNSGFVYGDTTITVSADSSIKLVAAFYDVHDNYRVDSAVTWGSLGLIGVPVGPASSIIFSPTTVDTGLIFTMSAIQDDTTGSIMVIPGRLAHIHIQNGPTGSAQEIGSVTLVAGQDTMMYAGGYDNDDNFESLISSNWSLEGDSIGVFSNSNPSTSNRLTGRTVGTAVVRAIEDGGIIEDFTSAIKVLQGDPSVLMKVAATDSQSGSAGKELPREIEVKVYDAFGNPVNGDTVRFIPLLGGLVNGSSSFVEVPTNALGIASVSWTLHPDTTNDSLAATIPNYITTPDTVIFTAFVNPGSADSLEAISALSDTGTVDTDLPSFVIRIVDSLNNPVPDVPISFSIVSRPAGSVGELVNPSSATTNALGQASTQLHLGSKIGTYIVRALAGTTHPQYVEFTGVANQPADPDTIIIVSGKNQTGTVARALPNPVQFKVTDQFGNIIANEPINFSALQGGSPNPAVDTTDAGGLASTIWTLGDSSGVQQLVASLPNFPLVISDTVTATATPDAANSLSLVTMRKLPLDSVAAVPGENITFVVKVRDQFNNLKPNATVRFASEPGYNALFESNQLLSDANGRVSNVVKTDKTKDSTFFRAYITSVDTLPLHIFHIRYVAGSLQPNQISPGDTAFQLQLNNTSPYAVVLDTGKTIFSFDDGSSTFNSALDGAVTLAANSSTTLFFDTTTVDSNFTNTTYTPEIAIKGDGVDSALAGNITLPINSLSIFNVRITRITATQQQVARGETFPITMTVRNDGPLTINVNTSLTTLDFTPTLSAIVSFAGGPTQLQPNSTNILTFNVPIPTNATLGQYTVDGQFTGTVQSSGVSVFDGNSDLTDTFSVVSNASINVVAQTLTPIKVTNGDSVTFRVRLNNSGDFGVILNPDSTYLSFGTDTILLSQSYSLPAGNFVQVSFGPGPITTPAQATAFTPSIRLYGTENEAEFDDTLSTAPDTFLVQNPPVVQVALINIVPDTVSQNQDLIQAQVILRNAGPMNATARISAQTDMSLSTTQLGVIFPAGSVFPIELAADSLSDTISFYYNIGATYPIGYDTAQVTYTFSDINSGKTYPTSPLDFDTVLVQSRARLFLVRNSLDPDTVIQGQTGIDLRFTVGNTGQASASIDSSDLLVQFTNPHDLTLTSPVSFPVILAETDTQEFIYSMDIDPNSGTGWDRYGLQVSHTDDRSGKTYTDVDTTDLDSVFILTPGSASNLEIQFVQIPKIGVNQGQTGVSAKVRLKNSAQGIVRVDSLFLLPERSGVNSTLITALPSNIAGGGFKDFNFTISIDSATSPGPVGINARYVATDLTSGSQFELVGSNVPDTINIFIPAAFVFEKLNLSKDTVSEGQTGIIASGFLRNGTDTSYSPVKVDSLKLLFDVGGSNITAFRLNPSPLPQLQGNDSVQVQFELQISDPSLYYGDVIANLEASGTDLTDASLVRDTSQVGDTLTIQSKGDIIIDSVRTPLTSASIGQTGIPVTVYFQNPGQALVDISDASLYFNNSTTGFFQTLNSIAVDPFTGNDTAFFSVEVLGSATPGPYTITSKILGVEQNTQGVVSDSSDSPAAVDTINITTPGQLRILSVSTEFDSVSIGSQGVLVSARIANMGSSSVLVDSLRLTFSKGSYTSEDTILSPPLALKGGNNTTIDFEIGVPGTNTPGVATINARVWGRDSLSLASLQDLGADTTDTWRLVTPAQLAVLSITPDSVSNGQNVSFSAQVQNSGQATVRYSDTSTYLNLNGTQVFVNQSGTIYGNNNIATLNFNPTTINLPPGNLTDSLWIRDFTENGFLKSDSLPVNLTVFDSAIVELDALTLTADTISQNMNIDLGITLVNNGANNADAIIDSVVIPKFSFSEVIDSSISGDGGQTFNLRPFVSDAFSGNVDFNTSVYWHDRFIAGQNILSIQDTVVVLNKASVVITSITADTSVAPTQTDIPVEVRVTNPGEVQANIQDINFAANIGMYTIDPDTPFVNIPPGDTITYSFLFAVNANSATGPDTIIVNVSAEDSISGNAVEADSFFSWIIESPSIVQILSAIPAQSIVSQGQNDVPVKVIFENLGGEEVRIDSVFLHFSNGDSFYTGIKNYPAKILEANQQDSVEFLVSVDGGTPTGGVTINATAAGKSLTTGVDFTITKANVKGFWTVQQRPKIIVPLLSLNRDTVSTGQGDIVLTFRVRNNGGGLPTATAQIDSMNLVINGGEKDSTDFTFDPQFTTPFNLVNNSSLNFNFELAVQNTALSRVHNFQTTIYYKDINDSSLFNLPADSGASDNLVVQQRGKLDITGIQIVPDSAYIGQNDIAFTLTAKNTGEGKVQLNSADLILHGPSGNFVKSLQTFGFPFMLRQNDSIDVNYLVDVPNNLNLPPSHPDTLIYAGGKLNGIELNSDSTFAPIQADSLDSLTVVNPAHVVFDSLVPTGLLDVNTTVSFTAFVRNDGGSNLYLNPNTRLRLVRISMPSDSTVIPINPDSSDMRILSGESTQLVFQEQQLIETGDFDVFLEIDGTVHLRSHRQTLTIPEEINVGGVLSLSGPVVTPSTVSPNQDSVLVSVDITNVGPTLFIDSAQTVLQFQYQGGGPLLVNSTRIDTLTKIPQDTSMSRTLEWIFKVPVDAQTGQVDVTAVLSFNGGTVTRSRTNTFTIASGVEIDYVLNTLFPNSTVPGQNVSFTASFINSGNTSLNLNPDSSYLKFTDGIRVDSAFVNGNLTIRGTQDAIPDTSVITFQEEEIDTSFTPGIYPVTFVMKGTLPNLDPYDGYESTFPNQLTVLEEANIVVDSIDIVPVNILAGQSDVEIQYYLSNTGNSPANLSTMTSVFWDSSGMDISGFWTQVYQSPSLPLTINEQGTASITRRFNVSPSIASGVVRAFSNGQYNDTRKPADIKTFDNPAIYDSVNVISPSSIYIDSLVLANVPNAGNGTVNYGQDYDLRLVLQNSGNDALKEIVVELRRNSVPIQTDTLHGPLAAGDTLQNIYNYTAGDSSQSFEYWAVLMEAISVTSGTPVPIGQPIDNKETVTIQQPSVLTLTAFASDSTLSQNQEFRVDFQITRSGQSPIGAGEVQILLPPNYSLAPATPDSVLPINANMLSGFWRVTADDTTAGLEDIITVNYAVRPLDLNTNNPVAVTNTETNIPVSTRNSGSVQVTDISIIEPRGAMDNILSTGQTFHLKAKFSFSENVSDSNREAELVLPAGAGFFADSTIKSLNNADSAIWQIRAPDEVTQTSQKVGSQDAKSDVSARSIDNIIEALQGELFNLEVIVRAVEKNTGTPLSASLDHEVEVQDRAQLEVHANIVAPGGATDGILSSDQSFDIRVWVENTGEAQTSGNNNVVLRVVQGFEIQGSSVDTVLLTLPTGDAFADTVSIVAPDTALASQQNLPVSIKNAASDTNSNKPAFVSVRQQVVQVNVVNKASLRVDNLEIVDPPGATDGTVSYGQTFTFEAVVNNTGQAGVVPFPQGPQGRVEIQLGDSLQLASGDLSIQDFDIGLPVQWNVQAGTNAAVAMLMNQIHSLKVQSSNILQSAVIKSAPTEQSLSAINERARTKNQKEVQNDSRISLLNQADRMELESVNEKLSQLYEQLSILIDTSNITVRIHTIPFDENTSDSAFVEQRSNDMEVYIEQKPFVNVASWQIRQRWSTDQIDTVEALISKPDQVTIISASLTLPPGFSNLGMEVQDNLYRWRVRTPQFVPSQTDISLHFEGVDQNNLTDTVRVDTNTTIIVESEAQLKLRSDVYSLRVSKNQKFTVSATILNEGEAGITGTGSLELLPGQMQLDIGEVSEKSFTTVPATLQWNLAAPDTNVNTLVTIRVKQRPLDINKSTPVQLNSDSSKVVIDVNMIPKRLFVQRLADVKPSGNYVQGSENVVILGVGLRNAETLKPDTIFVDQFMLSVNDPQKDNEPITDLQNLISSVKIVNFNDLSQINKPLGEPALFANMPINASTPNPIPVDFSVELDTVTSGDLDELVVLIDIAGTAPNRNFTIGVQNIRAYQLVQGAGRFDVDVTDSIGNPLSSITSQFQSPAISVVSGDPEKAFGNYPNPFGLDDPDGTKFIFFMKNSGKADLRIYTLLGELVWSVSDDLESPGLYDGRLPFRWDGRNNVGKLVLNGVYIAILKVQYTNGESKTFRTKVAFIK